MKRVFTLTALFVFMLMLSGCNSGIGSIFATPLPSPSPTPKPTPRATATPRPTPSPSQTPTPTPTPTPEPTQAPVQQYPDAEEYVINGASTSVKGMAEVKNAMKQYAKNNGIYLKTIETEIDGSLYLEIMCERSVAAATEINNQMLKAINGIDYDYIITITYLDIAKGENEANRVIMDADIYTNGSVKTYPRKGVQ